MTKTILTIVFMTIILLTAGVAASVSLTSDAEAAMKSKGTPNQVIGSKKVCGDRLCSKSLTLS